MVYIIGYIINEEQISKIIEELPKSVPKNKLIFFVGAGISAKSGLPLGGELIKHYMLSSLGEDATENLNAFWKKTLVSCSEKLASLYADFPMRLEFIIGTVNAIDKEFSDKNMFRKKNNIKKYCRKPLMNGFASFLDTSPNENHHIISSFIKEGANYITVNYDCCIEKALGVSADDSFQSKGIRAVDNNGHSLYHLHGIAEKNNNSNLGATIKTVNNRIPKEFQDFLVDKFNNGCCIIFLGYSASDYFDIKILFESMGEIGNGSVLFIDHYHEKNDGDKLKFVPEKTKHIPRNIQRLFVPFHKDKIFAIHCETSEFLKRLAYAYGIGISNNKKCEEIRWKDKFNEITQCHNVKIYNFINCIRFSSQSGIPLSKIWSNLDEQSNLFDEIISDWIDDDPNTIKNWVTKIMNDKDRDFSQSILSDIEDTCMRHIKKSTYLRFKQKLAEAADIRWTREKAAKTGFCYLSKLVDKAIQTLDRRRENKDYEDKKGCESTAVQSINIIASEFVEKWLSGDRSLKLLENMLHIRMQLYRLLKYNCNDFIYVSYYTSLLKRKNLIESILFPSNNNFDIDEEIIELSLEIASLGELRRGYYSLIQKGNILILHGNAHGIEYLKKYIPCYYSISIE